MQGATGTASCCRCVLVVGKQPGCLVACCASVLTPCPCPAGDGQAGGGLPPRREGLRSGTARGAAAGKLILAGCSEQPGAAVLCNGSPIVRSHSVVLPAGRRTAGPHVPCGQVLRSQTAGVGAPRAGGSSDNVTTVSASAAARGEPASTSDAKPRLPGKRDRSTGPSTRALPGCVSGEDACLGLAGASGGGGLQMCNVVSAQPCMTVLVWPPSILPQAALTASLKRPRLVLTESGGRTTRTRTSTPPPVPVMERRTRTSWCTSAKVRRLPFSWNKLRLRQHYSSVAVATPTDLYMRR